MMGIIIAFSGKAKSGKSTSAKILKKLAESYVKYVHVKSFASELKSKALEMGIWDGDKTEYFLKDGSLSLKKGRGVLIDFGQKMREIKETIWVDITMKQIMDKENEFKELEKQEQDIMNLYIIDDLRLRNELAVLKTHSNCYTIRITRNSQTDLNNITEKDLDNTEFDYYLDNNKDMKDIEEKLYNLFHEILKKHMK